MRDIRLMNRLVFTKVILVSLWNESLYFQAAERQRYRTGGQRGDRLLAKLVKAGGQVGLPEL